MTDAQVRYTVADPTNIVAADCAVAPSARNPREVTFSSAGNNLTGLAVGGLVVVTAAPDPENRGVYLVTRELVANGSYTAKKQGAGRDPVAGSAGSVTFQRRSFAKQLDVGDDVTFVHAGTGTFQPFGSIDGEAWAPLNAAISANGITNVVLNMPWIKLDVTAVTTLLEVGVAA